MQTQSLRQQTAVTPQQSLAVIKTLLSASFGCIAYLRNLLPEENFGEGRLMSGERGSMVYGTQSSLAEKNPRHASHITVKTVMRGYSTEADKLLNYLEHGIFDAIERQYLKSFIFAIYLDNDDPNNIVESYTYNLTYYTVPGTTVAVPIMSLDDQFNRVSLNSGPKLKPSDAVAQATFKGKAPTLGDVKQSIKSLIKNLILVTQSLEPLPRRRFATFKILYQDNTPPDYEPPYFRPGDPDKDRFVFTTHDKSEIPERISVGTVVTPHHGIDVQVQSIVRFIPNDEQDESQYLGIDNESTSKKGFTTTQGHSDAEVRAKQRETQLKDAESRNLAWCVEDPRWTDEDGDGEDDPEYVNDSGIEITSPLGVRQADGSIVPVPQHADDAMDTEGVVQYFGKPDVIPSGLGQLGEARLASDDLEATQQLEATQDLPDTNHELVKSCTMLPAENQTAVSTVDTQMLRAALDESAMDWTPNNEMLEMETQVEEMPEDGSVQPCNLVGANKLAKGLSRVSDMRSETDNIACACEHEDDSDIVFCEVCENWMHIRCMGYHAADDSRLPSQFVCIPCRLQGDTKFHLIKDKYPEILSAFVDLALFRRAIKLAEIYDPGSLKEFRILTKCSASLSEQLWNRLEREGFIVLEIIKMDKNGLFETRSRATRSAKKVKSEKQIQKYAFNVAITKTAIYRDYFSPDSEAERVMIKLSKPKSKKTKTEKRRGDASVDRSPQARSAAEENPSSMEAAQVEFESQTQDETQVNSALVVGTDLKRRTGTPSPGTVRKSKKAKISVVEENVDIEE